MYRGVNRRIVLAGMAAPFLTGNASAQAPATLDNLRKAGVIRVGLVNQPPYSSLNPDGTIGGFVPTLVDRIMKQLGVPRVEAFAASYGELIPGLQAGRWNMIAASLRLTKERCAQVLFTDPVTFDGGALVYVKSKTPNPPANLKSIVATSTSIGVLQGSYLVKLAADLGIAADRISQFPSNPALIDGLQAGRVTIGVSTGAALQQLREQRGGFDIVYPLAEDPPVGSAPAFSLTDKAFFDAFQGELRAMRKSGELLVMSKKFGFDAPPASLDGISGDQACKGL